MKSAWLVLYSVLMATSLSLGGCAGRQEAAVADKPAQAWLMPAPEVKLMAGPQVVEAIGQGRFEDYIRAALTTHPELAAQAAQWEAARASVDAAYMWPEPTVSYGLMLTPQLSTMAYRAQQVSVMQPLPWPYRPGQQRQVARAAVGVQAQRFSAAALMVRAELAQAYWSIWQLDEQRRWITRQISALETLYQMVQARQEVGRASLSQLQQLGLSLTRQRDALARLEAQREQAQAMLAGALGLEGEPTRLPISPEAAPSAQLPEEDDASLRQEAMRHPELLALEAMIAQRNQELELARTQGLPDMSLGVTYMQQDAARMSGMDGGMNMVMVMVGVKLPVFWGRYQAQRDVAAARHKESEAKARAARVKASAQVNKSLSELKDTARRVELYERTLMVQALSSFEAAVSAYEARGEGFAELMMAQRELYQLGLELVALKAQLMRAQAELERWVGRPVKMVEVPLMLQREGAN